MKLENIDTTIFDERMRKCVQDIKNYDPNKEPIERLGKLCVRFAQVHLREMKARANLGDNGDLLDYQLYGIDRPKIAEQWGLDLSCICFADNFPDSDADNEQLQLDCLIAGDYQQKCLGDFDTENYQIVPYHGVDKYPEESSMYPEQCGIENDPTQC